MRGLFFEEEELRFLAERLPRGLRIVDAGANTGNHTLFFATAMAAERSSRSSRCRAPRRQFAPTVRGEPAEERRSLPPWRAVGASPGRCAPVPSATAGLGATHFVPDPAGEVPVRPLDALVAGRSIFVKIDVEGMEMAGARRGRWACRSATSDPLR